MLKARSEPENVEGRINITVQGVGEKMNNPNAMQYLHYWTYIERPKRILSRWWDNFRGKKDNIDYIREECNKHRNEIILDGGHEIGKLLGFIDVPNDDYYYLIQLRGWDKKSIRLESCVFSPIWLKSNMSRWAYLQVEHQFYLNVPSYKIVRGWLRERTLRRIQ
jgi:hypothetical protein